MGIVLEILTRKTEILRDSARFRRARIFTRGSIAQLFSGLALRMSKEAGKGIFHGEMAELTEVAMNGNRFILCGVYMEIRNMSFQQSPRGSRIQYTPILPRLAELLWIMAAPS